MQIHNCAQQTTLLKTYNNSLLKDPRDLAQSIKGYILAAGLQARHILLNNTHFSGKLFLTKAKTDSAQINSPLSALIKRTFHYQRLWAESFGTSPGLYERRGRRGKNPILAMVVPASAR